MRVFKGIRVTSCAGCDKWFTFHFIKYCQSTREDGSQYIRNVTKCFNEKTLYSDCPLDDLACLDKQEIDGIRQDATKHIRAFIKDWDKYFDGNCTNATLLEAVEAIEADLKDKEAE